MPLNVGDYVAKAGIYTNPGVVTKRNDDGTVEVDTEPMTIYKFHRHANTTGLTEKEKAAFNQILDNVYVKENDVEKINDIQLQIDELKKDPTNKNIVQYLRNQQSHLVRKAKELPRQYVWDEDKIKV